MIRVLHFSDVHVQESVLTIPTVELLGKRALAVANLWLSRGRLFRDSVAKLAALGRFAEAHQVDFALCTGDYTAIGSEAEYKSARAAIESLTRRPLGFCTVPGNHDLYLGDTLRDSRFERHFGEFTESDCPEYVTDGPYPYVRFVSDALAIIGLNSAKPNPNPFSSSGLIPAAQLEGLARLLDDPRVRARRVFVMTHYGILRRDGRPDSEHHGLENAEALVRVCARPGVTLLHGHIHGRYCHPSAPDRPWIFCAGSATQRDREGIWLYEIDGQRVQAIPGGYFGGAYVLSPSEALEVTA